MTRRLRRLPLKRIRQCLSADLPCLELYRDEFEELLQILKVTEKTTTVLAVGAYQYDSLEEIQAHRGNRLRGIRISTLNPFVFIGLSEGPSGNEIYALDASDVADGVFYRAREFLLSKRRVVDTRLAALIEATGLGLILLALLLSAFIGKYIPAWMGLTLPLLGFGCAVGGLVLKETVSSSLNLQKRHEVSSFWTKNRDEVVKYLLFTILGFLLKYLYDKVSK